MAARPAGGFAGIPAAPGFDLTATASAFTPLGGVSFPVAQDRWERLVTMGQIPATADVVWDALTDPQHLREWLAVAHGGWASAGTESTLDFEDGEFFYCSTTRAVAPTSSRPGTLEYLWRWVGVGPATSVTWTLTPGADGTTVTVVEEATNPPSDWRSWNGMGWPGIVDQLAGYLRTGTNTRWPWRRMGPYLQIPLPAMPFQAWEALTSPGAVKHWMQRTSGSLDVDDPMTLMMGDASGTVELRVTKTVDTAQEFPSYMPYVEFELRRPSWRSALGGRMWIEPTGLGQSLLQVFHFDWERLDIQDPVTERKLLTGFWINAAARAQMLFAPQGPPAGPHGWSSGGGGANGQAATAELDFPAAMGFAEKVMGDLGGAMASVLAALGVRLGLFGALAGGPATAKELAGRTDLAERYVREWLWGLHSAGYLDFDSGSERFTLPPERAAVLADERSPLCLAPAYGLVPPLAGMLDEVAEAFRTGQGIPHEQYPDGLYQAMEQMSASWLDTMLVEHWLPAVPGLTEALERGGKAADVGSGSGRAVLAMAQRFPDSEFTGYDLHQPNVDRAAAAAEEAGLNGRARFEATDATSGMAGPLDLVTMFDVLHDAPDPPALLAAAHRALEPSGGVLLVLESNAAADAQDNRGAPGTILYATSTLYCVPSALADGGPALGTLGLPFAELAELAVRAGFTSTEEIPLQSPMNALYLLRP
ncbi:SRPBCC domain-containing protein [Amycolatopsis sp. cmx-11-32]|uniref:SRPBCC domain-containing protein n=1 Tax=Amycolatopsis sp. cmx-11-32 TaxID=2785796 RepID=UPI0039E53CE1